MMVISDTSLANVTMDTSIFLKGSTNNIALGVETCRCSKAYTGSSCQDPAEGYYRHTTIITTTITTIETEEYILERYIGQAAPCDCNGRSDTCDRETGHCKVSTQP